MPRNCLCLLIFLATAAVGSPRGASAVILSDHNHNHVITPGEPLYGVNLDGVAALGSGTPGSSSLAEIIVFQCSGALIGDRHMLTAAHCLDADEAGSVDFLTRSFPYVAGFQLPDRDVLIEVDTDSVHWPALWPEGDQDIGERPHYPRVEVPADRNQRGRIVRSYSAIAWRIVSRTSSA